MQGDPAAGGATFTRGKWSDAAQDAQDACELLASRPAAGAAFYGVGEIHRLRGEFARAEAAYTRANERGRKPQPGLSLLRLTQGQIMANDVPEEHGGLSRPGGEIGRREIYRIENDDSSSGTVVIGGSQAGLAVGYHLRQQGLPFVILGRQQADR